MEQSGVITFDTETHTYRVKATGVIVPSVTQIIKPLHYHETDTEVIVLPLTPKGKIARIPLEVWHHASQRGTIVHKILELYDSGTLDYDSVDERLQPYIVAWRKFLDDTGFKVNQEEIEMRVFNDERLYAGTLDRVGMILAPERRGEIKSILDIKTGSVIDWDVGLQLSAYQQAYNLGKISADRAIGRISVKLSPYGYKMDWWKKATDYTAFLNALNLYNWRLGNAR